MSYAENTKVPIDRSQGEIRKILSKHGATAFAFAENESKALLQFEIANRRIKFMLPMPQKYSKNASAASIKTYEQLCRARWRCLVLVIKAKMECVESGITTLEQEFMAHIVLPNGSTVGDVVLPEIAASYQDREMPLLLGMK